MWYARAKKTKAAGKWHHRAMLINPNKTKIIIVKAEDLKKYGSVHDTKTAVAISGKPKRAKSFLVLHF